MLRKTITALSLVALSACQVTIDPPAERPDNRPGEVYRPSRAEVQYACERQARARNLMVVRFGEFETVTGSKGVEIGVSSVMRVRRDGQNANVRCSYNFYDRQARITPIDPPDDRPGEGQRPSRAELREACTRRAQAQGFQVLRIGSFDTVTGSRGLEIGATSVMRVARKGRTRDLRCSYNFYDRKVRITDV